MTHTARFARNAAIPRDLCARSFFVFLSHFQPKPTVDCVASATIQLNYSLHVIARSQPTVQHSPSKFGNLENKSTRPVHKSCKCP